jgi:hypothetical protein
LAAFKTQQRNTTPGFLTFVALARRLAGSRRHAAANTFAVGSGSVVIANFVQFHLLKFLGVVVETTKNRN